MNDEHRDLWRNAVRAIIALNIHYPEHAAELADMAAELRDMFGTHLADDELNPHITTR